MFSQIKNRRQFIKLASGLLAAPLYSFPSIHAQAQTSGKAPLRFLTVVDTYGLPIASRNDVWVKSSASDYALEASDLGTILSPFSNYLDNMLVISGANMDSREEANETVFHDRLPFHLLSGSSSTGAYNSSGKLLHSSVDVHIGDYLSNTYGLPNSRIYPHLYFSDYAEASDSTFCFDLSGNQIRSIVGGQNAAAAVFGDITNTTSTSDLLLQAELGAHSDVLNLVSSRVQALKLQLAKENYNTALDTYNASVNDLARELELRQTSGGSCVIPDSFSSLGNGGRNSSENERADIFKVIAQAFACDAASSITYAIGGENINQHNHGFLYNAAEHDAEVNTLLKKNLHAASHITNDVSDKVHELTRIHQAEMMADLLDTMATTTDIDGSSVLDNTVIFWTSTMSQNVHKGSDFGLLLLAGKNTNLQGGYHYNLSDSTNNDLLTTIAQGLSSPIDNFGGYNRSGNFMNGLQNGPISKMLKTVL